MFSHQLEDRGKAQSCLGFRMASWQYIANNKDIVVACSFHLFCQIFFTDALLALLCTRLYGIVHHEPSNKTSAQSAILYSPKILIVVLSFC